MRIAVTGGSGRVGTAVTAAAAAVGHEVLVLDRRAPELPVPFREVDLTDHAALRAALDGCDVLVHLGGIAGPNEASEVEVHDTNVLSSYHALSAAAELGIGRVVQASSVNAVGATWSRQPQFDYFPVDPEHPTRNEDGYSLSKWVAEQQADSLTRRYPGLSVVSLRFHAFVASRTAALEGAAQHGEAWSARGLWGYTTAPMLTSALLLACTAGVTGHERLFVVAPTVAADEPSDDLRRRWYPDVELRSPLTGGTGFWDCRRTAELLGWNPGC
jgi:nucleoside-diphosphate-sugar epimerase